MRFRISGLLSTDFRLGHASEVTVECSLSGIIIDLSQHKTAFARSKTTVFPTETYGENQQFPSWTPGRISSPAP